MSLYLDEINEKLNLKHYNDCYINDVFFDEGMNYSQDSFVSILKKYSNITYSYKNITVDFAD